MKSRGYKYGIIWLVVASLFFYGWWDYSYLILILSSIVFNYLIGDYLNRSKNKMVLIFGIVANLLLLGYFKYANFFVDNLNLLFDTGHTFEKVILPLAISFFTFQQITFLVDSYYKKVDDHSFLHYCLFVTFFPQLIAGPIVHHRDMLGQFSKSKLSFISAENLSIGISIFSIGLFKKVVLADGIALHATPVFEAAELGNNLTFFEAWGGAIAYSLQLYFDFSGYSDMALGVARIFGIKLPVNFYSPYKSRNIIEFWRRWHITLSLFLRDYLYIPLGGNRKGKLRRYSNLVITMLLGGLWHGAGWTFVIWGGIHGVLLMVNHMWFFLTKNLRSKIFRFNRTLSIFITFLIVTVAWVMFRAESVEGAFRVYEGMMGVNGVSLPIRFSSFVEEIKSLYPNINIVAEGLGEFGKSSGINRIIILLFIVWSLPNTVEIFRSHQPALGVSNYFTQMQKSHFVWKPNSIFALGTIALLITSFVSMNSISEFLYFQF